MESYIVHDGATGQAIVASTGTPVDSILEALEAGDTRQDVLRAHPGLTDEDVVAALRFARRVVQRGARYPTADEQPSMGGFMVREPAAAYGAPPSAGTLRTYADVDGALLSAGRERERLAYRLDLMESIRDGLSQAAAGEVIPHDEVFAGLRARYA